MWLSGIGEIGSNKESVCAFEYSSKIFRQSQTLNKENVYKKVIILSC